VLDTTLAGCLDKKIKAMTTIVYNMGKDRFGTEGVKEKKKASSDRHTQEISKIGGELRSLKQQFRLAARQEKAALSELRSQLRTWSRGIS
jgi:hypothetical protein